MHAIAAIISYCTHDYRFIAKCIEEASIFATQIIVPVCSHFFNGEPENRDLLHLTYSEHPNVQFIEFAYHDQIYDLTLEPREEDWAHFWHSTARMVGFLYLDPEIEHVLFLDTDEIVDRRYFLPWLNTAEYRQYSAVRPLQLFYFRSPSKPCKRPQTSSLLAKRYDLTPEMILNVDERFGMFQSLPDPKLIGAHYKQHPLIHHYSWVRTKAEALSKVNSWGHRHDQDWQSLVDQEYSNEEIGPSFIWDYGTFDIEPYFDPRTIEPNIPNNLPERFDNVIYVSRNDIIKMRLLG